MLCHTTLLEKHEKKSSRSGVTVQSFGFVPLPPTKEALEAPHGVILPALGDGHHSPETESMCPFSRGRSSSCPGSGLAFGANAGKATQNVRSLS